MAQLLRRSKTPGCPKMKHISDYVSGRDNNFNLIRLLAAATVVFAHSFIIATGDRSAGPLIAATGHDLGYHAVNVFFSASGFLIAQSWLRTGSVPDFVAARMLRLWPALALCTFLLIFVIGPLLTSLPLTGYFSSPATYEFAPRVMSLLRPDVALPGVASPVPGDVGIDAPLWTLKYEVLCYVTLMLLGVAGIFSSSNRFHGVVGPLMLALLGASLLPIAHDVTHVWDHIIRFGLCFGFGVIAQARARHIPLTLWISALGFGMSVVLRQTAFYEMALCFFTAYTTMWLAFVPGSFIRAYNRLGDYSYGVYIFAYPIQILLMHVMPKLAGLGLFLRTMPIVLGLSVASWILIERPSLAHKKVLAERFRAITRGWTDRGWWVSRPKAGSPDPNEV